MTTTVIINKNEHITKDVLIMIKAGVFNFKSGRMIIHRDADGTLQKIEEDRIKFIKGEFK